MEEAARWFGWLLLAILVALMLVLAVLEFEVRRHERRMREESDRESTH